VAAMKPISRRLGLAARGVGEKVLAAVLVIVVAVFAVALVRSWLADGGLLIGVIIVVLVLVAIAGS
jgi:hypothetical protein